MNPYYDSERLGWTYVMLDAGGSYEFDMLMFWRTQDGRVFTAADSG